MRPLPHHEGSSVAMLALGDVPSGHAALDALCKEAVVTVRAAGTVHPGHYLILFSGELEACSRAFDAGVRAGSAGMLDAVLLPDAEPRIVPAILESRRGELRRSWDTLGSLESPHIPTLLLAVDAALKGAEVDLLTLRIGDDLGGKGTAALWGLSHDIEAALEIGARACTGKSKSPPHSRIIANLAPEAATVLAGPTTFFGGNHG